MRCTAAARALTVLALCAALGACTSGSSPTGHPSTPATPTSAAPSATTSAPPSAGVTPAATDWPTFGHDNARSLVAPGFPAITKPTIAWRARLDGAVYGQPIVLGDTVYAATENDTVYALHATDGSVVWQAHLGTPVRGSDLPCGDIDPLGITGAMAYDVATGSVFAVAETTGGHKTLFGLDTRTGAITQRRQIDPPKGDPIAHQQRSALTVLDGRVYVAYGGLYGDCGNYIGSVVGVPTRGNGPTVIYAIPTSREGGIWAPGGGAVTGTGANARLLYAVGNGESTRGFDGSDSVISLDAALHLVDRFAPSTWADDNAQDRDLGSMGPAIVGDFVYADGKRGTGYVLRAGHLGGVGGDIKSADVCRAFGAAAVDGNTVYVPCRAGHATRAIRIGADGTITPLWETDVAADGSPVLGGGSIWVTDWHIGLLYLLDPATGHVRAQVQTGGLPHFATPSLAGGRAFLGTLSGVIALH